MTIQVENNLILELINKKHAEHLLHLVDENRLHLSEWLPWVQHMTEKDQFMRFAENSNKRYEDGMEIPLVIIADGRLAGRIGIYSIDAQNKTGAIGYWLGKKFEGRGLIVKSTAALITFAFDQMNLNRIEIKCGTENYKSQAVPERLNFYREGLIRQGELHSNRFIDLYLYSLLKDDWKARLKNQV